jgi:hypothetical protein
MALPVVGLISVIGRVLVHVFGKFLPNFLSLLAYFLVRFGGFLFSKFRLFLVFILTGLFNALIKLANRFFPYFNYWLGGTLKKIVIWLASPFHFLLVFLAGYFVKVVLNYFGYSFLGIIVSIVLRVIVEVAGFIFTQLLTFFDFSGIITGLGNFANLPSCVLDIMMAVGLGQALSMIVNCAIALISINLARKLFRV